MPTNPYEAVLILSRKDLFRDFLKANKFNVPEAKSFYDFNEAIKFVEKLNSPCFVKPVDSSGSKGVTRLVNIAELESAFHFALQFSKEKKVIIEREISKKGYQVAGDGFVMNGEFVFRCWADEHFDKLGNGIVPIGQSFPSSKPEYLLLKAHYETQKIFNLLGIKMGSFNFDFVFSDDDSLFFLEIGARNGGCLIPDVIKYATNIDLIKYTVDIALGLPLEKLICKPVLGFWSSYMLHSLNAGLFNHVHYSDRIKSKIIEEHIWVEKKQRIEKYIGANNAIGALILKFESYNEMVDMIDNMENEIRIILD